MAPKRKSDVGPTNDASDNQSERALKASRTDSTLTPHETIPGQRFGESADYIPLNQLSQVVGADEDDEEALNLFQGSQEVDDSSLTNSVLYGMHLYTCAF
jgi:SWI/SNF-related matrix-associated actin-dependent regulator of chromatin subfamily A3